MLHLSETRRFLQISSFWEERCALIGQLSSAFWLAKYLKRVTEMLRPFPYGNAVSRRDETKTVNWCHWWITEQFDMIQHEV